MKGKKIAICLLPLFLVAGLSGCSTFKGWLKKSEKPDRPPEVMADEGIKQLKNKKYSDAIDTFEKVRDRYPYSEQATLAQIKVADAYYYNKKFDEALSAYREFEKLHPTNKAIPYCIYREGLCFYRQRSTVDRDQTFTQKALEEFSRLKQKYPNSEFIPNAEKWIAKCRQDLAEHEFYIANFYYKTKRYQAAIDRYQALTQDYPEFPKNAEAQAKIKECQDLLAAEKTPSNGFFSKVTSIFDAKW